MEKETIKIDDEISFNLSMEAFEIKQNIENVVTPKKMRTSSIVTSEICLNESYTKCAKNDYIAKSAKNDSILAKSAQNDSIAKRSKIEYITEDAKSAKNDSIAKSAKIEYIAEDEKSAKIKYIAKEAKIDSMKSVHTNSQVPCAECGKVFRNIMLLKGHVNNVHIKVPCSICQDMIGKGRLSFHKHQKHTPASERKYKCEICGKGFCDKSRLKDHINVHTGEKPNKCKFCGKGFASNGTKAGHERSHMGLKRKNQTLKN